MKLTKSQRAILKQKYRGRCAYCGCDLPDRWCADHIQPIVRLGDGTCKYPENNHIDNFNPSCASCNIIKGSGSLEDFRRTVQGFIKSLNRDSTQYKFAKRYGLIKETETEVKFYFEEYETIRKATDNNRLHP